MEIDMEIVQLSFLDGKVCRLCQITQPLDNFYMRSETGVRRAECKACFQLLRKAKRDANIDAARAKQRERHHERKNDAEYIQYRRDQWTKHRDKRLSKKAEYSALHREEINAKANQYYHRNREQVLEREYQRRRNNPEHYHAVKKRSYWNNRDRNRQKSRDWGLNNPELKREGQRRYYQSNKEHVHQKSQAWRRANRGKYRVSALMYQHKRRAKMQGQTFRWRDWLAMCDWFGNVCLCCGSNAALTVDHVIPVEHDGPNLIENLQPLCLHCNTSKGAYHSTDYRNPDRLAQFLQSIGHSLYP
jgi:Zn ribbon nucleic-acid-binding protein